MTSQKNACIGVKVCPLAISFNTVLHIAFIRFDNIWRIEEPSLSLPCTTGGGDVMATLTLSEDLEYLFLTHNNPVTGFSFGTCVLHLPVAAYAPARVVDIYAETSLTYYYPKTAGSTTRTTPLTLITTQEDRVGDKVQFPTILPF